MASAFMFCSTWCECERALTALVAFETAVRLVAFPVGAFGHEDAAGVAGWWWPVDVEG